MKAGGYTFMDYVKVGLPLQIIIGVVMTFVLPLLFLTKDFDIKIKAPDVFPALGALFYRIKSGFLYSQFGRFFLQLGK